MNIPVGRLRGLLARAACAFAAAAVLAACGAGDLVRVEDKFVIEPPAIAEEFAGADVVFVGEHHDDHLHHRKQLMVIRALHESGADVAVGLEMFLATENEVLDGWVAGTVAEGDIKKVFAEHWTVPWAKYRAIFVYARDNGIPLVGLNISKTVIHQVFTGGFASLEPEMAAKMPGASCDVDEKYEEFIREAIGGHDHHKKDAKADADKEEDEGDAAASEDDRGEYDAGADGDEEAAAKEAEDKPSFDDIIFKKFCEAQVAWDTAMAYHAVEYLKQNPGRTLVILTGSAHSWKRGMPRRIAEISELDYRVIIPESSDQLSIKNITLDDADYLWLEPW